MGLMEGRNRTTNRKVFYIVYNTPEGKEKTTGIKSLLTVVNIQNRDTGSSQNVTT